MKNSKWDYDERQWQIAGKVFYRGFLTTCIILMINGLLQGQGIMWANGFYQNFLILTLLHTIISFEAILRGVYFGKCGRLTRCAIICVFGAVSVLLWVISMWCFTQGAELLESYTLRLSHGSQLLEGYALSSAGFSLALGVMLAITTAIAIIAEIDEKRRNSDKNIHDEQ